MYVWYENATVFKKKSAPIGEFFLEKDHLVWTILYGPYDEFHILKEFPGPYDGLPA